MKRLLTFFIILLLAVSLVGCGGKPKLSWETFEKLRAVENLSYKQAAEIIGAKGKLHSETKELKGKTYMWEDKEKNAYIQITFHDGVAVSKQGVNLSRP